MSNYNPAKNSADSYNLSIAEMRKRKIASGEIVLQPGEDPVTGQIKTQEGKA